MTTVNIASLPVQAEVKRLLFCIEVDKPSVMQLCYDVDAMNLHQQALLLLYYLKVLREKLIIAMETYKCLQKVKQLKEYKQLVEEMLKEDRYTKVLEALFIISYPEILQQLQQQQQQQNDNKMHT
jgi:hypothetical protein